MGLREISHPEIQASFQQDPPTSKLSKMGCLQVGEPIEGGDLDRGDGSMWVLEEEEGVEVGAGDVEAENGEEVGNEEGEHGAAEEEVGYCQVEEGGDESGKRPSWGSTATIH